MSLAASGQQVRIHAPDPGWSFLCHGRDIVLRLCRPGRGTRLGRFEGRLYRGTVRILAHRGSTLDLETTFFLSPDWPAGNFVGYVGFLDRLRFAVDPLRNLFYFGPLE